MFKGKVVIWTIDILLDYPIHIDTSMELPILYFNGLPGKFLHVHNNVSLPRKIDFILANSADTDKMMPYAAFCLGRHCMPTFKRTE